MPEYTNADLELLYLRSLGAVGTLLDCQRQIYGAQQWDYFSVRSGLTPVNRYSLADHKYAYYKGAATAWTEKRRNLAPATARTSSAGLSTAFSTGSGNGSASVVGSGGVDGGTKIRLTFGAGATRSLNEDFIRLSSLAWGGGGTSLAALSPVLLNTQYTMSVYVNPSSSVDVSMQPQSLIGSGAGTSPAPLGSVISCNSGVWTRVPVTFTTPTSNMAAVRGDLDSGGAISLAAGATVDLWGWMLEQAPTAGLFFDGDTAPANALEQYRWVGAANDSPSVYETRLSDVVSSGSLVDVQRRFWKLALGL